MHTRLGTAIAVKQDWQKYWVQPIQYFTEMISVILFIDFEPRRTTADIHSKNVDLNLIGNSEE